jgi:hypothetical protein
MQRVRVRQDLKLMCRRHMRDSCCWVTSRSCSTLPLCAQRRVKGDGVCVCANGSKQSHLEVVKNCRVGMTVSRTSIARVLLQEGWQGSGLHQGKHTQGPE